MAGASNCLLSPHTQCGGRCSQHSVHTSRLYLLLCPIREAIYHLSSSSSSSSLLCIDSSIVVNKTSRISAPQACNYHVLYQAWSLHLDKAQHIPPRKTQGRPRAPSTPHPQAARLLTRSYGHILLTGHCQTTTQEA